MGRIAGHPVKAVYGGSGKLSDLGAAAHHLSNHSGRMGPLLTRMSSIFAALNGVNVTGVAPTNRSPQSERAGGRRRPGA